MRDHDFKTEIRYLKKTVSDLEDILEGSFDGILVTDAEGKVLYVNSSYERVAEIKRRDMEGRYMEDLINPVWMPNSVAYMVIEQKAPVSVRQLVKSGRHIMVTGRPVLDKKGNVQKVVINARDITEIYELREEVKRTREVGCMYMDRYRAELSEPDADSNSRILAVSHEMQEVLTLAEHVANFQANVLILGESGVGKEEVACHIHRYGVRREQPFITLNCGAIPANLLESELFGYEKGAFTGAMQAGKVGLLEAADGGTVFLDEIGETPLDFQVKLLRFLETREVRRVGAVDTKTVNVRIVAATNRNIEAMVEEGTFREDLYYRLNVVKIDIPPLRQRKEDIMPLATMFLNRFNRMYAQEKMLTPEVVEEMEKYKWSGNVRQLKNVIENMVVVSRNEYLQTEDLPWVAETLRDPTKIIVEKAVENYGDMMLSDAMEAFEKLMFQSARERCDTTREMAVKLGVNQSTVVRKLQKYGM